MSRSAIDDADLDQQLTDIVERSVARNGTLEVSGALAFSGSYFAQYIEGPPVQVDTLRAAIQRDPRHTDLVTLSFGRVGGRVFESWSLAYAGPSVVVSRALSKAFARSRQGLALEPGEVRVLLQTLATNRGSE